jgi:hypothetical protein
MVAAEYTPGQKRVLVALALLERGRLCAADVVQMFRCRRQVARRILLDASGVLTVYEDGNDIVVLRDEYDEDNLTYGR